MTELLDARGVAIAPGDTVIYGFGVSRSIAMAEGVVVGEGCRQPAEECRCGNPYSRVSLTPSGRVRVRIIRRSYSSGTQPVVDVAPDRMVVLKPSWAFENGEAIRALPPSPLPTQDEKARANLVDAIERYTEGLRSETYPYWAYDLADYHTFCATQLRESRRKLKEIDDAD